MDPLEFYHHIIWPTLDDMGLRSDTACPLLLGTALVESGLEHIVQTGSGPALGPYQMEHATHDDIWAHYLAYRDGLANRVARLAGERPRVDQLIWNLGYATAIASGTNASTAAQNLKRFAAQRSPT